MIKQEKKQLETPKMCGKKRSKTLKFKRKTKTFNKNIISITLPKGETMTGY